MRICQFIFAISISLIISSCTREFDCADTAIEPTFIGYQLSDVNNLVIRKYNINNNFQQAIDSFVRDNSNSQIQMNGDTIHCYIFGEKGRMVRGYEWEIYLPSPNRKIRISSINGEQVKGKCGKGLFSMDPVGCQCYNRVFSCAVDNVPISFSTGSQYSPYTIFIQR